MLTDVFSLFSAETGNNTDESPPDGTDDGEESKHLEGKTSS